jgi:hypothetical protein
VNVELTHLPGEGHGGTPKSARAENDAADCPPRAAGVSIRISIEQTEPLTGTAAAGKGTPVPFMGWLEMLRTISELVSAKERDGDRSPAAEGTPTERKGGNQDLP